MTIRALCTIPLSDAPFRHGLRPRDLAWNPRLNEPEIIQMYFTSKVRITWNPDDGRFYLEHLRGDDWITRFTFAGNSKGWHNAINRGRAS